MSERTILFVCSGNICRSPMAEGLMRKLLDNMGIRAWITDSAGTLDIPGRPASRHALMAVSELGGDISDHLSRHLDQKIIQHADIILAMEEKHRQYIYENYGNRSNVYLLSAYPDFSRGKGIDDPIGMGLDVYLATAEEIYRHLKRIVNILVGESA